MGADGAGLTYLLISILLYHVSADSNCLPFECLNCDSPSAGNCQLCSSNGSTYSNTFCDVSKNCTKDIVQVNATSSVDAGTKLTATCIHNLSQNLSISFKWHKNQEVVGENTSVYVVKILEKTTLACTVLSPCGNFSSQPKDITPNDQTGIILLICGVSAVVVIILLAVIMKILMKRNEVQREARKRQRQANIQNISSTATTTTGYW